LRSTKIMGGASGASKSTPSRAVHRGRGALEQTTRLHFRSDKNRASSLLRAPETWLAQRCASSQTALVAAKKKIPRRDACTLCPDSARTALCSPRSIRRDRGLPRTSTSTFGGRARLRSRATRCSFPARMGYADTRPDRHSGYDGFRRIRWRRIPGRAPDTVDVCSLCSWVCIRAGVQVVSPSPILRLFEDVVQAYAKERQHVVAESANQPDGSRESRTNSARAAWLPSCASNVETNR